MVTISSNLVVTVYSNVTISSNLLPSQGQFKYADTLRVYNSPKYTCISTEETKASRQSSTYLRSRSEQGFPVTAILRWHSKSADMVDDQYRGLLTDREREILIGEAEVSDDYRYRVVSRIRTKLENLEEDIDILADNRQDLYDELREVVCENSK